VDLGFLIALSLALGAAAWLFFLWSVKSGQYEDPEGPKYRMLEDDPEEGEEVPGKVKKEEVPGKAKNDSAPPRNR
jgi:cbb3-type cytochrome oxidase maturation protein